VVAFWESITPPLLMHETFHSAIILCVIVELSLVECVYYRSEVLVEDVTRTIQSHTRLEAVLLAGRNVILDFTLQLFDELLSFFMPELCPLDAGLVD